MNVSNYRRRRANSCAVAAFIAEVGCHVVANPVAHILATAIFSRMI